MHPVSAQARWQIQDRPNHEEHWEDHQVLAAVMFIAVGPSTQVPESGSTRDKKTGQDRLPAAIVLKKIMEVHRHDFGIQNIF